MQRVAQIAGSTVCFPGNICFADSCLWSRRCGRDEAGFATLNPTGKIACATRLIVLVNLELDFAAADVVVDLVILVHDFSAHDGGQRAPG